ncbi:hypothetical protein HELRODRAFT_166998 [Helobdella robusta]|uniref:DUF7042 domain-containing protein n=1 Tax=Helobdella robusta TaxID=6412 RepID=T1EYV2_HELRO|nr:hypothetical protein HELRODRAFT_166998 [Helobdella robusta]ESO11905.1 hypothetical protein HELRODRAFT_166998 [Helobdella robusta]
MYANLVFGHHPKLLKYEITKQAEYKNTNQLTTANNSVNSEPTECPLTRAYHVIYSNVSRDSCRSPTSYSHVCSSGSSLLFRLRKCRLRTHSFEQNVQMDCISWWKEGANRFLFVKFTHKVHNSSNIFQSSIFNSQTFKPQNHEEGQQHYYRCAMYQIIGAVAYLSVSSNSSCSNLRSAREGPLVFELTEATCHI